MHNASEVNAGAAVLLIKKVYFEEQYGPFLEAILGQERMLVWKALENLQILRFGRRVSDFGRKSPI